MEEYYASLEPNVDNFVDSFIINLVTSTSDSSDMDSNSSDSDCDREGIAELV